MNRPENVPTDVWATANADEQAFIIEHENLHKQFRDWLKATADFATYVKLDVDHIRAVFPFKAEG